MKSKVLGFGAVALLVLGTVFSAFGQRSVTLFSGMIGEAKVELALTRDGENLTGDYYYRKSGSANRLKLSGKIGADGSFTLQESTAAGKQTGSLKGKWKEEANASGAMLEGEWLKPGQKDEGLGFYAWQQMIDFTTTKITTREIKEAMKPKKATLSAEYPELTGNANAAGFNALAKAEVTKALAGFRKDMNSLTAADVKMIGPGMGNYIDVGYGIEYADEDLISVNFTESTFEGGAHPNSGTTTLTYDLKAGRRVQLADLFKPGAKYLAKIADYATKDLQNRKDPESGENMGIAQDIWLDGVKPTADNYSNWNITKKGLLITFPAYQVAAYAYGPQTVIVPYSALKDIAKPDGALAKSK
ncbi:MAG: DUF3298 and DUF4163 domain-containing protein [Acidobacteria bacterium]|nr:DUF3298 and DUF4163 domain-containing protein [Acidobacteriota bacterium]